MQLAVKPIRRDYYSCIDGILATMANYFGKACSLMFIGYFGFEYSARKEDATSIGEKLSEGIQCYSRYSLHRYHNLKATWHNIDNYKKLHSIIVNSLNDSIPMGVYLDSFFCPWNNAYQKFHINHYVLIIGINDVENKYICLDPYSSEERYQLSYEFLEKGFREYISFEDDQRSYANFSLSNILQENFYSKEHLESIEQKYDNIMLFACDLTKHIDIDREISPWNGDLQSTVLFRKINSIGKDRAKFAYTLRSLSYVFESSDIYYISLEVEKLCNCWDNVNSLLFKYHFRRTESIPTAIYEKLNFIAEAERLLSLRLIKASEHNENIIISFNDLQRKCGYDNY